MPGTIVVAATATGLQPPSALFLDGTDVLRDTAGGTYGVPIESIQVTEAGPGSVSSMDFTIDDPTRAVTLASGQEVLFVNLLAGNGIRFKGVVDHWSMHPDFGGQGRTIKVSCTGPERWLDLLTIKPAVTIAAGSYLKDAIVQAANAAGGPLRVGSSATPAGSLANPVGTLVATIAGYTPPDTNGFALDAQVFDGPTLREAINTLIADTIWQNAGGGAFQMTNIPVLVTVDFYMGLRVWLDLPTVQPDDYTTLTVTDTTAGVYVAENLEHATEPDEIIREVWVTGTAGAVTGWLNDGSGIRGKRAMITWQTSNVDTLREVGRAYLAGQAQAIRASLQLTDFTPPTTVHVGSLLALTDAATGSTGTYRIYQIRKSFNKSGRENWDIAYGGLPPSAVNLIRKLTRAVAA